jgi:hypothetical protein
MPDDEDGWADQVVELLLQGGGREAAAGLLREQVAAGVDRSVLLAELESMRPLFRAYDHAQDGLQELMDRLAGWCPPSARI